MVFDDMMVYDDDDMVMTKRPLKHNASRGVNIRGTTLVPPENRGSDRIASPRAPPPTEPSAVAESGY